MKKVTSKKANQIIASMKKQGHGNEAIAKHLKSVGFKDRNGNYITAGAVSVRVHHLKQKKRLPKNTVRTVSKKSTPKNFDETKKLLTAILNNKNMSDSEKVAMSQLTLEL